MSAAFLSQTPEFSRGADTPRAFLERCLARVDALESEIGAFEHIDAAGARRAADAATERWRAGRPLSPIDGMPVGIKDIIETIDMPTGMGSPLFTGWRSERDGASVAALREAGAVIVGKTVTTEFAATVPGKTRNPLDPRRTPGGSSSGSAAAVAAGMLSGALGTQVVGSTVRPASYCGIIGFKPSVGAINRGGSHDALSQSVQGVLAGTLADAWQIAIEIALRAGGDPGYPGLFGPASLPPPAAPRSLALLRTAAWERALPAARAALEDAVARLAERGVRVVTRESDATLDAVERAIVEAMPLTRTINAWETRWPLNTYRARDAAKLSGAMLERLAQAEAMTLDDYRAALRRREEIRALFAGLAGGVDACVTLSAPGPAPEGIASTGDPAFAVPASLLGAPAISLPAFEIEGLPLGLQLVGFRDRDAELVATAGWIAERLALAAR